MANEFARFAKLPEPTFEKIELNTFIAQNIELFDEEQTIIVFQPKIEAIWIHADKDMLSQVLDNLLLNAKQATDSITEPQIFIDVQTIENKVLISIKDNGVGISLEQQERIFTPYFTTKSSGSGIGLSVVRQIIEKHDGEVSFESLVGSGTTFYLKLARAQSKS